jgi:cytidyltransferase-like protein
MSLEVKDGAKTTPTIVYVDGIFDMFHVGHVEFLKRALEVGGDGAQLLVGVISDEDASWKRKPIMSHPERAAVVRACKYATTVVDNPPLILTETFLDRYGITCVIHGDDDLQTKYFAVPIARGIMKYVPYHRGISTTDIIERVRTRIVKGA